MKTGIKLGYVSEGEYIRLSIQGDEQAVTEYAQGLYNYGAIGKARTWKDESGSVYQTLQPFEDCVELYDTPAGYSVEVLTTFEKLIRAIAFQLTREARPGHRVTPRGQIALRIARLQVDSIPCLGTYKPVQGIATRTLALLKRNGLHDEQTNGAQAVSRSIDNAQQHTANEHANTLELVD